MTYPLFFETFNEKNRLGQLFRTQTYFNFYKITNLKTLLASKEVGPCLIEDKKHNALYIFNHFEYDSDTLKQEYDRDLEEGKKIFFPKNYYPDDDPQNNPKNRWRSHAHLLYGNWINEIYQTTPYDLNKIGS